MMETDNMTTSRFLRTDENFYENNVYSEESVNLGSDSSEISEIPYAYTRKKSRESHHSENLRASVNEGETKLHNGNIEMKIFYLSFI